MTASTQVTPPVMIGGRFTRGPRIGSGSFGVVFMGTDGETRKRVAIKGEPPTATHRCMEREVEAYSALACSERVPKVLWQGPSPDGWRLIVTELLGPSLEDLLRFCGKRFSLKCTLMLMDQMICCLEVVHAVGLLHRDLKPDNFLIGLGAQATTVHLIDYGLSASWIDPKTRAHIPYREGRGHVGTARFSSAGSHLGRQQSRRDDLESLGYLMMYFLRGSLPWQHAQFFCRNEAERLREIKERKVSLSIGDLCGRWPREIGEYLRYTRSLRFTETPDYAYLRNLLGELFVDQGFEDDSVFDWTLLTSQLVDEAKPHGNGDADKEASKGGTTRLSDWRVSDDGDF